MREKLSQWADYFAAVALALWVAAGILFLMKTQSNENLAILAGIGVVFFALFVYFKFALVRQAMTSRVARYSSNALIVTVAFIGIVGVLNFMGARYHLRQDVTTGKTFTLSEKTTQILKDLKTPVQAIAFFTAVDLQARQEVEDRLREYSRITDKFTYQVIDPQEQPQLATDYKVQFDGTVVMERGTRRENALQSDEQSLTNAIWKVSQDTQPTVYFTTGHGELSPDEPGTDGYSLMKSAMELENYKVQLLDLKTLTSTLPSDIAVLIIAGPRQPFDPQEVSIVREYLNKNGRALIMIGAAPLDNPQFKSGLDDLLSEWSISVRNDLVIDPKQGFFGQSQVPVVNAFRAHAVTQDLAGQSAFFPSVRSLQVVATPASMRTATVLFSSSDQSWGETDFASLKAQSPKQDDKDVKGPLDLAAAVEAQGENPARIVVIGNANFISNGTLNARITVGGQQQRVQSGNGLLFGNALHWLAGQETLIAIPAKQADQHPVFLTAEQLAFVFWSSFLLIPLVILILGALLWWRRR